MEKHEIDPSSAINIQRLEELQCSASRKLSKYLVNKMQPCSVDDYFTSMNLHRRGAVASAQRVPKTYSIDIVEAHADKIMFFGQVFSGGSTTQACVGTVVTVQLAKDIIAQFHIAHEWNKWVDKWEINTIVTLFSPTHQTVIDFIDANTEYEYVRESPTAKSIGLGRSSNPMMPS